MNILVNRFAEALKWIDKTGIPFKNFHPGVGPYGEPKLLKKSLGYLRKKYPDEFKDAKTKRIPDIYIPGNWALEFKIVRPFGDNGKEAEQDADSRGSATQARVAGEPDLERRERNVPAQSPGQWIVTFRRPQRNARWTSSPM